MFPFLILLAFTVPRAAKSQGGGIGRKAPSIQKKRKTHTRT